MKKYAMTISAFLLASPGFFMIGNSPGATILFVLIGLLFSWGLLELYISVSRPFNGVAPSHTLIKLSRMLWLLFAVYAWWDFKIGLTRIQLNPALLVMLVLCYLVALMLRIYAVVYLGPSFSYDVQIPASQSFKRSGPYRFIRHPAYLSICILGSLPGLMLGSVIGFIGMTATSMTVILYRVNYEDRLLENYFGQSYIIYKKKTFRLIPFIY